MALISNASIWEKSSVVRVDVQIRTFGIEAHLLGYFLVFPFWWKIITVWIKLFSELSVIKILWHGSLNIQDVRWRHLSVSDTSCCQWGETVIIDGELISWFYMRYLHSKGSFEGLKRAGIIPSYNCRVLNQDRQYFIISIWTEDEPEILHALGLLGTATSAHFESDKSTVTTEWAIRPKKYFVPCV